MKTEDFFKSYPLSKEVFQTSDGYLFHKEPDAKNHANSLKDKSVKKIGRSASQSPSKGGDVKAAPANTDTTPAVGSEEETVASPNPSEGGDKVEQKTAAKTAAKSKK